MNLEKQINEDWKQAYKDKDTVKKNTLTLIRSNINKSAKEKQKDSLCDMEVIQVLRKMVKNQKDSNSYLKDDALEQGERELSILESYMPAMMNEDQIESVVAALLCNSSKKLTKSDMGIAMSLAMNQFKGQADGTVVRKVMERILKD